MVRNDKFTQATRVIDMTQDLKFEKAVLIATTAMALFLFVAQSV